MNLNLPEGIEIEYKAAEKGLPRSFWETYSAFANTNGGVVILGYDERDKVNPIKGFKNPQPIYDQLLNDANNSITDRFPHFQLDYFEKDSNLNPRWIDRVSTGDASYPDLNMFDFLLIVMDKLAATVKDPFILDETSKTRIPFKKDLEESLREALVNCLMHAYYDADFPIKITALPDYYEFKNPGNMRVSIDEFIKGNNSVTRNPTIATLLRKIGLSEKAGSGGQKIFDMAAKHNLILPTIQSPFDSTTIIIWKVDFKHNINQLPEPDKSILEFISANGSIKRKQIENDLGLSGQEYSYRKALDRLTEKGFIKRVGNGPGTKYILKKSSQEHYYLMKQTMREIEDALKI